MPGWRLARVGPVKHIDTPALMLGRIGVEVWRPAVRKSVRRGLRRRVMWVPTPVFGPYIFLRIAESRFAEARGLRSGASPVLAEIISGGCGVSVIPDDEIAAARAEHDAGAFDPDGKAPAPVCAFASGDSVTLDQGAFVGFPGMIRSVLGDRARVMVNLFGRATEIEMPVAAVRMREAT